MSDSRANPDDERPSNPVNGEPQQESAAPVLPEEEDVVESEPAGVDGTASSAAENGHLPHP